MANVEDVADYWNHNSAYHQMIVRAAAGRRVLDVGSGDGLLLQRLATVSKSAFGIEPDPKAFAVARIRLRGITNTALSNVAFADADLPDSSFDLITFVATLHHLDLEGALRKVMDLLAPGGELIVVGLSSNRTMWHWLISAVHLPLIRIMGLIHRESNPEVVVAQARESLDQIRSTAQRLLPGVRIRRALYYRYILRWTKPPDTSIAR